MLFADFFGLVSILFSSLPVDRKGSDELIIVLSVAIADVKDVVVDGAVVNADKVDVDAVDDVVDTVAGDSTTPSRRRKNVSIREDT